MTATVAGLQRLGVGDEAIRMVDQIAVGQIFTADTAATKQRMLAAAIEHLLLAEQWLVIER